MNAKHWTGAPGDCSTDPECQPRAEHDGPQLELCDYCGKDATIGRVTIAGQGLYCSRDCADAAFGRVYMTKKRRTA